MKPLTIFLIVAVAIALYVVLAAVTDEAIPVDTNDADYEVELPILYADGTMDSIKQFKAMEAYHDDKIVDYIGFQVDVKWKSKTADDVRIVSPRSDRAHETKLVVSYQGSGSPIHISTYPLSQFTDADYSTLERGEWYHLFKGIKVTMTEVQSKIGLATSMDVNWSLRFELTVWYNTDRDSTVIEQHVINVHVPLHFPVGGGITPYDPVDPGPGTSPAYSHDATFTPLIPQKPIVVVKQGTTANVSTTFWMQTVSGTGGSGTATGTTQGNNLDQRGSGGFFW